MAKILDGKLVRFPESFEFGLHHQNLVVSGGAEHLETIAVMAIAALGRLAAHAGSSECDRKNLSESFSRIDDALAEATRAAFR